MEPLDKRFNGVENPSRIGYLIGGFITGTLSIEEREELDAWVISSDKNMQLFEDLTDDQKVNEFMRWLALTETESKLADTKKRLQEEERATWLSFLPYAAAACLLVVAIVWFSAPKKEFSPVVSVTVADIEPGKLMAELRLPDGRRIDLGKTKDTVFDNIQIVDGSVNYLGDNPSGWHEVVIPRKGFFKLQLPDGSKVWLNSESSIKYPGSFDGPRREVTVTGETYFEVHRDPSKPFIVSVAGRKVQALGTAFNINEFERQITLTEGSVSISGEGKTLTLLPGEQADFEGHVRKVVPEFVVAWTNNQFRFHNQTIYSIKPILERWYNAKLVIEDSIVYHFNGTIHRSVPVSRVMQLLQGTGHLHYQIANETITITR